MPKIGGYATSVQHVKVTEGRNVFEAAQERIAHIFDVCDTPVVSFSGGKDSTCVLQLALAEAQRRGQSLHVLLCDEEIIDPDTLAYWERVREIPGVNLHWVCAPIRLGRGGAVL